MVDRCADPLGALTRADWTAMLAMVMAANHEEDGEAPGRGVVMYLYERGGGGLCA